MFLCRKGNSLCWLPTRKQLDRWSNCLNSTFSPLWTNFICVLNTARKQFNLLTLFSSLRPSFWWPWRCRSISESDPPFFSGTSFPPPSSLSPDAWWPSDSFCVVSVPQQSQSKALRQKWVYKWCLKENLHSRAWTRFSRWNWRFSMENTSYLKHNFYFRCTKQPSGLSTLSLANGRRTMASSCRPVMHTIANIMQDFSEDSLQRLWW